MEHYLEAVDLEVAGRQLANQQAQRLEMTNQEAYHLQLANQACGPQVANQVRSELAIPACHSHPIRLAGLFIPSSTDPLVKVGKETPIH